MMIGKYLVEEWLLGYKNFDRRDVTINSYPCGYIFIYENNFKLYLNFDYPRDDQNHPFALLNKVYKPNCGFTNITKARKFVDNFLERLQKLNAFS